MLVTETEAKTKWCPMARVVGAPGSEAAGISWNRYPGDASPASSACCIASGCMMWRWEAGMVDSQIPQKKWKGLCGLVPPWVVTVISQPPHE